MTMDQWFALLRASMQYKDYRAVYPVPVLKKMLDAVEPDLPTFMELAADMFRLVEGNDFTNTKINGHLDQCLGTLATHHQSRYTCSSLNELPDCLWHHKKSWNS